MDSMYFVIVFERCMIPVSNYSVNFLLYYLRVGSYKCRQLLFFLYWGFFCVSLHSLFENTILIDQWLSILKYHWTIMPENSRWNPRSIVSKWDQCTLESGEVVGYVYTGVQVGHTVPTPLCISAAGAQQRLLLKGWEAAGGDASQQDRGHIWTPVIKSSIFKAHFGVSHIAFMSFQCWWKKCGTIMTSF